MIVFYILAVILTGIILYCTILEIYKSVRKYFFCKKARKDLKRMIAEEEQRIKKTTIDGWANLLSVEIPLIRNREG